MNEITSGLWRWVTPHPEWNPGASPGSAADWERDVGSVLHTTPEAAVFIDPLVPEDEAGFWRWADPLVAGRDAHVLTTIRWHRRSRQAVADRYRASVSRAERNLPDGVSKLTLRGAGETIFWLAEPRALVPGDRILGSAEGGLRLCPESWLRSLKIDHAQLRRLLAPVLDLPVERVLVSHGEPLLSDGAQALRRLLGE